MNPRLIPPETKDRTRKARTRRKSKKRSLKKLETQDRLLHGCVRTVFLLEEMPPGFFESLNAPDLWKRNRAVTYLSKVASETHDPERFSVAAARSKPNRLRP